MTRSSPRLLLGSLTAAVLLPAWPRARSGTPAATDGRLSVVASFYPLQYVAERIAGDRADVTDLTTPGQEPHDLELSLQRTAEVTDADLVVYARGLQPAVDDAVDTNGPDHVVDASASAGLEGDDPHFWQDPERVAKVAGAVADQLSAIDPAHADGYAARLAALDKDLTGLDQEYRTGLADCAITTVVVSHDAFGYLSKYGLDLRRHQRPVPRRRALARAPGPAAAADHRRPDHHRLLRDARQPRARRQPGRRPRDQDRRPRPDRGADRRDRRPGLPQPDALEPQGPGDGEQLLMTTTPAAGTVALLRDAGVVLGGRPVLRGVDLTVRAGEVLAVLGANGSGKSTLVRTLLGLVPLRRGEAELFGTPVAHFHDWRRVGFVPQRTGATAGVPASVWEVVSSGRLSHRRPWQPARKVDREVVRRSLAEVGLADRARDGVATLSGGQQQRVLIARALAGEPDLLVLDEPTAGVDADSQETLASVVGRLVDRGTTVVLVAHEMGPLEPLIGRTVVLRDGRVVYDGSPLASFTVLPRDPHPHPHGPESTASGDPRRRTPHGVDLGTPLGRRAGRRHP